MGLPEKSYGVAGSDSDEPSMTTEKRACFSSHLYSMGLINMKNDVAAGSGSNVLSMATEKKRGLLLIFILWGYLRKATARQVVAQISQV